jgi:hypothetical protein
MRRLSCSGAPSPCVGCPLWFLTVVLRHTSSASSRCSPHSWIHLNRAVKHTGLCKATLSGRQTCPRGDVRPGLQDCFRRKPPTKWQEAHAHGSIVRMGLIEAQFLVPSTVQYLVPSCVHVSFVAVCRYGRRNQPFTKFLSCNHVSLCFPFYHRRLRLRAAVVLAVACFGCSSEFYFHRGVITTRRLLERRDQVGVPSSTVPARKAKGHPSSE